jgi:hypothetical protein
VKKRIGYTLFLVVTMQLHAADWFKKAAKTFEKKVIKPIEQKVVKPIEQKVIDPIKKEVTQATQALQDPAKLAIDASKQALNSMGINIDGITSSIDTIKSLVPRIQRDVQDVQTALNANMSPVKQGPIITQAITQFQAKADIVVKQVAVPEVTMALSSMASLGAIVQKLATNTLQTNLRELYEAYNKVIQEIDAVDIQPILRAGHKLLTDMATLLENVLKVRDYSGTLSRIVITNELATAMQNIVGSLRAIAGDLDSIIQGGVRKLQSVQGEFANGLLSNFGNISRLIASIQETINSIPPQIDTIAAHIRVMNNAKDQIAATANISKQLEQQVQEKIKTVVGIFEVPTVATDTLRKIIMDLRNQIHRILSSARDTIAAVAAIILTGINGMEAFKVHINFDIVPPSSRVGLQALPNDVQRLSSSIEQLRRALII